MTSTQPVTTATATTGKDVASVTSDVTGSFRFFFQRGQPAQPFQ